MQIKHLEECTTAGAVATVAQPFETVQKREPEKKLKGSNLLKGIKTSAKYANSLHEGEVVQFPGAHTHEGKKVDRMVGHVKSSEQKLGKSAKEAENIAWATANKRGMLDNKNKKKGVAEGSVDPELRHAEEFAKVHYTSEKDPEEAFKKYVQRSLKHTKEDDDKQNLEIRKIKRDMDAIRQMASNGPMAEGEITEDDVVLSADRRRPKSGLLSKPEPTMNPADTVKLDVPLLIRLLEFAKEDAADDMALHDLAEKLVARGSRGRTLTMKDYDNLVPKSNQEMPKKDSKIMAGISQYKN